MPPVLRLNDLAVRRGGTPVLEGLSWTATPGRPHWIVGPNGTGKTSLLRVIAGLDAPAAGTVEHPPDRRPLYFHAETSIPPDATVGDWARLAAALLPAGRGDGTALWPEVPAGRRTGRLSTGERKRLLLDVLLRVPGSVVLLDEPFEHLSPDAKATLSSLIEARAARDVVIVATNQGTGRALRDGGLRLEGGVARALPAEAEP